MQNNNYCIYIATTEVGNFTKMNEVTICSFDCQHRHRNTATVLILYSSDYNASNQDTVVNRIQRMIQFNARN